MTVLNTFAVVIMGFFLAYMGYRLFLRRKLLILVGFCLQIVAITIAISGIVMDVGTDNLIEAAYIVFGIAIPFTYFVYDYTVMLSKIRTIGIYDGFVKPVLKPSDDNSNELGRRKIRPIIKQREVPELIKDLNLNKEDILRNIKKSLNQAQVFIEKSDFENAYDIYNTIIRLVTNCPNLYYNYGNICYLKGQFTEALHWYRKVLEVNGEKIYEQESPEDVIKVERKKPHSLIKRPKPSDDLKYEEFMTYYNMGNTLFKLGRYEEAIDSYKKSLEINPALEDSNENISRALIAMGRKDEALEYYRKVVSNNEKNYNVHFIIGRLLGELKRYDEAISELKESIKLNSGNVDSYAELGRIYSEAGKDSDAVDAFKKLVKKKPDDQDSQIYLAKAYDRCGKTKEALDSYKKAYSINNENAECSFGYAVILDKAGMKDEAVKVLKKLTSEREEYIDAYNMLGRILACQGRHMEALNVYTTGLNKNPEAYNLYINMGDTLFEMERNDEAIEAYKSALEIENGAFEACCRIGDVLSKMNKFEEATREYSKALEIKPHDGNIFYKLALVYSLHGKKELAVENLKKAIDFDKSLKREAKSDTAFDGMRDYSEFKKLVS